MSIGRLGLFIALLYAQAGSIASQAGTINGKSGNQPFTAVFVDDATEKALGPFPYDRSVYARALIALRKAEAKAVVVKCFLDHPKNAQGDDLLAKELRKLPVLLQARMDPSERHPNPFPSAFNRAEKVIGDSSRLYGGNSGWIPIAKFSSRCADIGFVDVPSTTDIQNLPLVFRYQDKVVPSLELIAVERAIGETARITLGRHVAWGGHTLPVDASGCLRVHLPVTDTIPTISFIDLLNGKFDTKRIKGKIVILGVDTAVMPTIPTPTGLMRIHRFFYHCVVNLYDQLQTSCDKTPSSPPGPHQP